MVWCSSCARNVPGYRPFDGELSCDICGRVLEDFNFSTEATFVKNAAGQSQLSGNIVRTRLSDISASRERTLRKSREEMTNMRNGIGIGDERDDVVEMANRIYRLAVERDFTRGRRAEQVQASCLYFACREKNIPFLLIDFSNYLSINVYELGAVYLQLCELLYLAENKNFDKLVDPSIFIPKFTNSLLSGGNKAVIRTARDIIASMKRDWMQTGRKPSGICGAALYIAALSHGLKCSKLDIVKIVHICEATLTKRLIEFENTESGSLTVEEFTEKAKEFKNSSSAKQPNMGANMLATNGVLCKHQGHKPFAYGLCQSCYDDFMTVSGGIVGGSDPPAFQRAERERLANESAEENANGSLDDTMSQELNNKKNSNLDKESSSQFMQEDEHLESLDPGTAKQATTEEHVDDKFNRVDGTSETLDESDSFSDIDDVEVDGYLHNEQEKHYKKIIWEQMNREYLEEQAAKEEAAAAAKEALKANYENCPGDYEAAKKLAEATAAALAKSRKERQQKRAAEAKHLPPAQTAAEATRQMLSKKRISSKINYDALEKLFDASVAPENPKKSRTESHSDDDEKVHNVSKKKSESDATYGFENGDLGLEDDYNNEHDAGEAYGYEMAYENLEEAYDEDYGYDEYD